MDDHSRWKEHDAGRQDGGLSQSQSMEDKLWHQRLINAIESVKIRKQSSQCGDIPLCAERLYNELKNPQTDWREILADFISEEVCDYSFMPPDRRFDDSPFYLPDFNDTEPVVKDILFMIDTSGSMSDEMITAAHAEVKGAIDQFNGKLQGWLGFFDASVVPPKPFENEEEFSIIKAKGGGGTSFHVIFEYVKKEMSDRLPASIIILTDGYAPFPNEASANYIPVLWLLNNNEVKPPWGKMARIEI